jgi:hypothetical protein
MSNAFAQTVPTFDRKISIAAHKQLYEFACLVFFARKIAATDNATGYLPLFFEH